MSRMWQKVAVAVAVHLLLLSAVFDIYFVSPIQHGMPNHKADGIPPAKRVVLFVAAGLRAESLYSPKINKEAPYLKFIMKTKGAWGVSHIQVPTESRPGHVALLAGFNEDSSAITKGWKSNPVYFDSVINQSTNTWCWGSPDILDIFKKDGTAGYVSLHSYDAYVQDFSGKESPAKLDNWVFSEVEKFINQQNECRNDSGMPGNIFFLHLLGLDTAGHSFKPGSKEHIGSIKVVDRGVSLTQKLFEYYFKDKQTAYIFTSDHGMTNWGSHGDGSQHETEVPFIAWGAGIRINTTKQDIYQTDIAPLISALIGINFPVNSMGVVPLKYINASDEQKASILYANALQLSEQYITKHKNLKANTISWTFRPYHKLSEKMFLEKIESIRYSIHRKNYQEAINSSYSLIDLCKEGLLYYKTYYQYVLLSFVTTGFVGWIVYLFISIKNLNTKSYREFASQARTPPGHTSASLLPYILNGLLIIVCLMLLIQPLQFKYHVYCVFPILTWLAVVRNYKHGLITLSVIQTFSLKELICLITTYIGSIELLICTFFDRRYLTFLFTYYAWRTITLKSGTPESKVWAIGHFFVGLGPCLFDLQTTFNYIIHVVTCFLWMAYMAVVLLNVTNREEKRVLWVQSIMLFIAFMNSLFVSVILGNGGSLTSYNQLISWLLLIASPVFPFLKPFSQFETFEYGIISEMLALITPYTLMGVGYENLYMYFFIAHMLKWIFVEEGMTPSNVNDHIGYVNRVDDRDITYTDKHSVQRCFYVLAFIMLSYFGVGNTGSINSYDPMWVRCFVTIFSPFTMTALIFIKLYIPFLIVMCAFKRIMYYAKGQIENNFLIILLFCDLMVIQFLYYIKK